MHFDIDQLRSQLRDVPLTTSFSRSVELLEDAFDYTGSSASALAWNSYRYGDDAAFFGERTLESLFEPSFQVRMGSRLEWQMGEIACESHHNLRTHIQGYVVVGYRSDKGSSRAACVLFHSGSIGLYDGADGPPTDKVGALELVRVRFGLMNRRQAHLLANHLNRFRRNRHHGEALTWVVKRGPEADASARAWLDAVAGESQYMQHTAGELPSWGLGTNTAHGLAIYTLESRVAAHPDQVFSYGRARCLLPPRFLIYAGQRNGDSDLPTGETWNAVRATECADARGNAERVGLGGDSFEHADTRPEDMWGQDESAPPGDGPGYTPGPVEVYATSFGRKEAPQVMRALRKSGYRGIVASLVGVGGSYVRWESGNPYFRRDEVHLERELKVGGAPALDVRLFAHFVDFKRRYAGASS